MRQNHRSALLSVPARISLVVLLAGLGVVYVILSNAVARRTEETLTRDWAASGAVLASLVRDGLAASLSRGQEMGEAFDAGAYREALGQAGPHTGMLLVAPDLSAALWSKTGAVPDVADLAGYAAAAPGTGGPAELGGFLSTTRFSPFQLVSQAGDRLPFNVISTGIGASGWTVMLFQDRRATREVAAAIVLSQTIAFLVLAVLLLLLLLGFYVSLAGALSTAVRSAAALEEAGRRFAEQAGALRAPLSTIQGLADMLVITEDPDERANYLSEIKQEIRRLAADLQVHEQFYGR